MFHFLNEEVSCLGRGLEVGVPMIEQRRKYPTDLTEAQWRLVEPVVPPAKPDGYNRRYSLREILNGISYVLRTGCAWRHVPHDLPHWEAVYSYFRLWRRNGVWQQINELLQLEPRTQSDFAAPFHAKDAHVSTTEKEKSTFALQQRKQTVSADDSHGQVESSS
jgi:putative transposase